MAANPLCATFLVLITHVINSSTSDVITPARVHMERAQKTVNGGLNLANSSVKYGTDLEKLVLSNLIDLSRGAVVSQQEIMTKAIPGALNIANEGLDLAKNATADIPVVSSFVNDTTNLAKEGVDFVNAAGQVGIAMSSGLADDFLNHSLHKGDKFIAGIAQNADNVIVEAKEAVNSLFDSIIKLLTSPSPGDP